jgi:hypothetical protein
VPRVTQLRLGSWARAGNLVGLVVGIDGDEVTLFDPGQRHQARLPVADVQPLPAGGVRVTVTVDLPLPHGIGEPALRRWVAMLTDEVVRERAHAALVKADLDPGAALPSVRLEVSPVASGTVCLCGQKMPAPAGAELECINCGRTAVGPATSTG